MKTKAGESWKENFETLEESVKEEINGQVRIHLKKMPNKGG